MPPKKEEVGSIDKFPKEGRQPPGRKQTDAEKRVTDAAALASIESFLTDEDREELKKRDAAGVIGRNVLQHHHKRKHRAGTRRRRRHRSRGKTSRRK